MRRWLWRERPARYNPGGFQGWPVLWLRIMSWSFRIGRLAGIDIRIHITFLIIVFWGAAQFGRFGPRGMLFGAVLILLLFACVLAHELGHSVVAQRFGIAVRQIVLLPIGGVAMMSRMPSKPAQELWVALAGPLVNVVIAGALLLGVGANVALGRIDPENLLRLGGEPSGELMLLWLLNANIVLVLFNMIPAFPLDGGRVLRAILAMNMSAARATRIAATVGQALAVVLGTFGLVTGQIMLAVVALFIFFGAAAEQAEGAAKTVLSGLRVGDAYNRHALTLAPHDTLGTVVNHILTSYQPDFAVTNGRRVLGIVTRDDVVRALAGDGRDVPVTGIMHPEPLRVGAHETLERVREMLAERGARVAAVYDGPAYLGLVSAEDIAEAYALLRFLDGNAGPRRPDGAVVA
jgi:Zn-dependent protease/predicted transcriptional regulator